MIRSRPARSYANSRLVPPILAHLLSFHIDPHSAPVTPLFLTLSSKTREGEGATLFFSSLSPLSSISCVFFPTLPNPRKPHFSSSKPFPSPLFPRPMRPKTLSTAAPRVARGPVRRFLTDPSWTQLTYKSRGAKPRILLTNRAQPVPPDPFSLQWSAPSEPRLRQTSSVLYIAVDSLLPVRGKSISGFDEFTAALDHAGIPAVWLTSRSRLQFDEPRRRLGHQHPFIAEDGCCVYLPEGYFNVRPDSPAHGAKRAPTTLRLGRFMCVPSAEPLPAAADALEALAADTRIDVVTLRSLSPRELSQNSSLPLRDAELARQRDFDELFFFAGASDSDIARFASEARNRKLQLRPWPRGAAGRERSVLWSLAVGASVQHCIRDLSKLYDRALRQHAHTVGVATAQEAQGFLPHCERAILLSERDSEDVASEDVSLGPPLTGANGKEQPSADEPPMSPTELDSAAGPAWRSSRRAIQLPLHSEDVWERLLETASANASLRGRRP